ncbi:cell division protein FtsL [Leuconostoc palmae]|uniref:cell division protein FtsL n=1 Tax=Leuconostoc palmae TaxID=501487 RepID=UPI001C7D8EDB|nr:cell division protein FtsL [Leuconostoc palmae]
MAQNAYQFTTSAERLDSVQSKVTIKYKSAPWTRRERLIATLVSAVVMTLMIGVVFSSMQANAARTNMETMQAKIDKTREANDALRSDIKSKTNKKNLDEAAKKYNMTRSNSNVRNINQ